MKGSKYLSELVDLSLLKKDHLNVIKAPTGSGKTYFALNHIPSLSDDAIHNVVYLTEIPACAAHLHGQVGTL